MCPIDTVASPDTATIAYHLFVGHIELAEREMAASWAEIINRSLAVEQHGKPFAVPAECVDQAMPNEYRELGVSDPVRALSRALRGKGLYVDRNDDTLIVIRLPE